MSSTRTTLKLAVAAGAVTNLAGAAIISADFSSSPLSITYDSFFNTIYVDFETATAVLSNVVLSGYDGVIGFTFSSPELGGITTNSGWRAVGPENYALGKLVFGNSIAGQIGTDLALLEAGYNSPWDYPNDGLGYLGFINTNNGNQAWLYVNYLDNAEYIQLLGMGYNPNGTLTAGEGSAIPEPAAATALAALLAGGVAAFQRRRRAA